MGWEALAQWGDDVARIEPLAGGVANDVWSVRVNGLWWLLRSSVRKTGELLSQDDISSGQMKAVAGTGAPRAREEGVMSTTQTGSYCRLEVGSSV